MSWPYQLQNRSPLVHVFLNEDRVSSNIVRRPHARLSHDLCYVSQLEARSRRANQVACNWKLNCDRLMMNQVELFTSQKPHSYLLQTIFFLNITRESSHSHYDTIVSCAINPERLNLDKTEACNSGCKMIRRSKNSYWLDCDSVQINLSVYCEITRKARLRIYFLYP